MRRPRRLEQLFWSVNSRVWDDELDDPTSAAHVEELADLLAGELPAGAPIIDLGCGTGNHSIGLADRGMSVVGLDLTSAMLARARAKSTDVDWVRGDLAGGLPFRSGSLAGALSIYAAQFLDLDSFLPEVRRVLAIDAPLLIEAPRPDPTPRVVDGLALRYRSFRQVKIVVATVGERLGLVRAYSFEQLGSALEDAGFRVAHHHPTRHSHVVLAHA